MGELHTRMTASGNTAADRTGLRTDYLPALRKSLVKPMVDKEKEGIMAVIYEMQVILILVCQDREIRLLDVSIQMLLVEQDAVCILSLCKAHDIVLEWNTNWEDSEGSEIYRTTA